jgi:hypothetical protein
LSRYVKPWNVLPAVYAIRVRCTTALSQTRVERLYRRYWQKSERIQKTKEKE